jgi:hypothetical protein
MEVPMRFSLRWLLALALLVCVCADAEAGFFRHRGRSSCVSGSCQPAPQAAPAPTAPAATFGAVPLTATGSSCANGSCAAPAAKRGLFGPRR